MNSKKTLFLVVVSILLAAALAQGQTAGTLDLSGSISDSTSLSVTPEAVASALDLTTNANNLLVATVTEVSNLVGGYSITVLSNTGGFLRNTVDSNEEVAYTLKYDGVTVDLSALATPKSGAGVTAGYDSQVVISFTGGVATASGTYADTLTFTIVAT